MAFPTQSAAATIRLDKVLMVVNNDIAQSNSDADDYISRRGLTSRKLAFNFGTAGVGNNQPSATDITTSATISCQTAGAQSGLSFIAAISSYIRLNDIDCVICSTYTPAVVSPFNVGGNAGMALPFATVAGLASTINAVGISNLLNGGISDFFNTSATLPTDLAKSFGVSSNTRSSNWLNGTRNPTGTQTVIPHGRLGCNIGTSGSGTTIGGTYGGFPVELPIYPQCVIKAMLAEQQDNSQQLHVLTNNLQYTAPMTTAANTLAYNWAKSNKMNVSNFGVDIPLPSGGGDGANGFSTALGYSVGSIFGYCVGVQFNFGTSGWSYGVNSYLSNYSVAQGGWWFNWTSSAYCTGYDFMGKGGSAAIITVSEPYNVGMPQAHLVFLALTNLKCTMAAANFAGNWNCSAATVYGDPLYSPYKSTKFYSS